MIAQPLDALLPLVDGGTLVRKFRTADLERFHAYRSDEGLAVYQGWSATSLDAARRFVAQMASVKALAAGGWVQLAIADSNSNELLGDLGLYLERDVSAGEVGFTLSRGAQGQGHATRAVRQAVAVFFAATAVPVVRAVTDARNVASVRVLERVGFTQSAVRQAVFKGAPCTELTHVFRRADV